jgi:fructose-bisphosphate aldolase class II
VLTGDAVSAVFALAKHGQFALPAVNCTGTNTINPTLETAAQLDAPVIVQFSHSGAAFIAGKGLGGGDRASILGAIAGRATCTRWPRRTGRA